MTSRARAWACAWAITALLVGSITLAHSTSSGSLAGRTVETPLRPLASGSSGGTNSTNGTASVVGTLLTGSTDVWWLNNTNATGASYAKLDVSASSGVANLAILRIGIDNGTQTDQVVASAGLLTQTGGAYVRLPPASANKIYATQAVVSLGVPSSVTLTITVSDDELESASVEMQARLDLT